MKKQPRVLAEIAEIAVKTRNNLVMGDGTANKPFDFGIKKNEYL